MATLMLMEGRGRVGVHTRHVFSQLGHGQAIAIAHAHEGGNRSAKGRWCAGLVSEANPYTILTLPSLTK